MTPSPAPIFLISFRARDELAGMAERAGWKAIAARRADSAERRFVASGAAVAVVDVRGAYAEGLDAVRLLADAVEANAAALLVLVARRDIGMLDALFRAGATHYLVGPVAEAEFALALRFATRHAERLVGGRHAARGRAELLESEATTWRWRPGSDEVEISPAFGRRFGLPHGALAVTLRSLLLSLGHQGRRVAADAVARLQAERRPTAFAHAVRPGEETRLAHHLRLDAEGAIVGHVEELDADEGDERRSRDALTGVEDQRSLRRWMNVRLNARDVDQPRCVLILIAVQRFDAINAAFGTGTGDAMLQAVARRIERQMGEAAARRRCIARVAGAEFAVAIAAPIAVDDAVMLARQIADAVSRPFVTQQQMVALSARVGIAVAGAGDDEAGGMLRRASIALADAKAGDIAAIRVLDASGEAASARDNRLEADLRAALERDEIEILFQPQVAVTGGAIVGVEALARWRHPDLGELGAVTLFAAAERSGYLVPLSEHVQKKAVMMAARWPAALSHLRVAVNVTAADIARPDFAGLFLAMVDASGFPRGRLTVEITEGGLIDDLGEAAALLAALRAGGLRVAIDDFGTGYSSLAYLKALPLDYLKIDQHLAADIAGSARDRVVVRGVIEMARSLGLSVVAEGVESEAQLALLAADGCNYYQGYLCAPPLAQDALERLVLAGST